ncbi:hypothetical protein EDD18DRAFT_1460304 [Armillaria luteobubalina]|uniref:Uncharacterized protein n=1 Tax=Armillaria luteobubalina TaxID=153913 RepID=A0AA39QC45_9AGAR|nr:hypothetical protein EDD18DRAFT_1460304 [Armillaria luteobubalina]
MDIPPSNPVQPGGRNKSDASPPSYELPYPLLIGRRAIQRPLVNISQLKGHLCLLKHFASLKKRVEGIDRSKFRDAPKDRERTWSWFVELAVERFERWCKELTSADEADFVDKCLPPVDVIMVWHAYLLNPARYSEDSQRNEHIKVLAGAGDWFKDLECVCCTIDSPPSEARVQTWLQKTHVPYDPFESAIVLTNREIICPQCLTKANVRLMDFNATGYFQPHFKTTCPGCRLTITKEQLGLHKLVKDLVGTNNVLAGTLHTSSSIENSFRAKMIKTRILEIISNAVPKGNTKLEEEWVVKIQKEMYFNMQELKRTIGHHIEAYGEKVLFRIMSVYTDDRIFSLDLAGAVLRQGAFVDKMCKLGWTEPDFFSSSEDEVALKHCTARYHAFLDLISSSPACFFVPTLDIDLVWHTHQLMARWYSRDCLKHVGRFIDHDDKVAEDRLSNAFDITCRAWQDRFGISYTYCGCPLPGDTIGQRLRRLISVYKQSDHLVPPRDRSDLLAATHPSDHNAVYLSKYKEQVDAQRYARQTKRQRRIRRDEENGMRKGVDHDPAFLVPVPLCFNRDVECVAMTGHVLGRGGGVWGSNATGVDNRDEFEWDEILNNSIQTVLQLDGVSGSNCGGALCGGGGSGDGGGGGGGSGCGGGCGGGD